MALDREKVATRSEMQILEQLAVIEHRLTAVEAIKQKEESSGKKKGGPKIIEWGLIAALIAVAAISALQGLFADMSNTSNEVRANMANEQAR